MHTSSQPTPPPIPAIIPSQQNGDDEKSAPSDIELIDRIQAIEMGHINSLFAAGKLTECIAKLKEVQQLSSQIKKMDNKVAYMKFSHVSCIATCYTRLENHTEAVVYFGLIKEILKEHSAYLTENYRLQICFTLLEFTHSLLRTLNVSYAYQIFANALKLKQKEDDAQFNQFLERLAIDCQLVNNHAIKILNKDLLLQAVQFEAVLREKLYEANIFTPESVDRTFSLFITRSILEYELIIENASDVEKLLKKLNITLRWSQKNPFVSEDQLTNSARMVTSAFDKHPLNELLPTELTLLSTLYKKFIKQLPDGKIKSHLTSSINKINTVLREITAQEKNKLTELFSKSSNIMTQLETSIEHQEQTFELLEQRQDATPNPPHTNLQNELADVKIKFHSVNAELLALQQPNNRSNAINITNLETLFIELTTIETELSASAHHLHQLQLQLVQELFLTIDEEITMAQTTLEDEEKHFHANPANGRKKFIVSSLQKLNQAKNDVSQFFQETVESKLSQIKINNISKEVNLTSKHLLAIKMEQFTEKLDHVNLTKDAINQTILAIDTIIMKCFIDQNEIQKFSLLRGEYTQIILLLTEPNEMSFEAMIAVESKLLDLHHRFKEFENYCNGVLAILDKRLKQMTTFTQWSPIIPNRTITSPFTVGYQDPHAPRQSIPAKKIPTPENPKPITSQQSIIINALAGRRTNGFFKSVVPPTSNNSLTSLQQGQYNLAMWMHTQAMLAYQTGLSFNPHLVQQVQYPSQFNTTQTQQSQPYEMGQSQVNHTTPRR